MLNTENANAVVGTPSSTAGKTHKVEMLIGTYVKSVGKDIKEGAVVEISDVDYRFLKPYGYCKDFGVDEAEDSADENSTSESDENSDADETSETDEIDQNSDEEVDAEAHKAHGKRKR